MKSFQITVRKILMLLGVLIAFVPCALLLSACGESSIGQSQEKQYSWAECHIANGDNYVVSGDYQITISKDIDIHDIIGLDNFVITLHYTDDSFEVITSGYTVEVVDNEYDEFYPYTIQVKYQDLIIGSIGVKVEVDLLPMFANVEEIGSINSGYRCSEELRYTGDEYDITQIIKTNDNVTLAQMISDGQVTVDTENWAYELGAIRATLPNVCGNDYDSYGFTVRATPGYQWLLNGTNWDHIDIIWTIKRAIIETPELTSGTTFTYQHRWDEDEQKYVGIEQGLTFDYGNGADYITPAEKQADAWWYQTTLNIKDEYANLYTFLINGQEQTYTDQYNWSITPMELSMPTIENDHYVYTGENIKPTLTSDYLSLFNVEYPISCADANRYSSNYSVLVTLIDEYANSNNYDFNNNCRTAQILYYIDPAPFPTDIWNQIKDIDFVVEKTYDPNVNYEWYFTMSTDLDPLANDDEDIAKLQYNEYSYITYSVADGLNWTDETKLDAGTYSNVIKVTYQYDRNYEDKEFYATLVILPIGIELCDEWSLSINSGSGSVSDNAVLIYNENITYNCYLWNTNDDIQISYTNNYGENENDYTTTKNTIHDAGYYQVVANITPIGGTTNYYLYLENDANKTPISTLTYSKVIHINKKIIYDYPFINGAYYSYDIDFYEVADTLRSLVIESFGDNSGENVNAAVDLQNISQTTYYSTDGSSYSQATNTVNAGYYKTIFAWHLLDDYATNYALENGGLEKEWRIYPNTYTLQTTDASASGYIGWGANTDFNLYYWEETNDYARLLEKLTMPDGISVSFEYFDTNPSQDNNGNWYSISQSSGVYMPNFGLGDYLVWAKFKIKDIPGSDNVTVTCNENPVANPINEIYSTSNFAHFEIVEKTPIVLALGSEQSMDREYFKYYKFTTTSTENEKYIIMVNIEELSGNNFFGYGIHLRAEADDPKTNSSAYVELSNRTLWYGSTYYFTLDNLSANTSYVLRVGSWTSAYEDITPTIKVMAFPTNLTFVYDANINQPNGGTSEGAVVSAGTDLGEVVTIPYAVYIDVENENTIQLTRENVYEIAANGFKDQTQITTLYLPGNLVNIGESAFDGCTNLTAIYYGAGYGNWNDDLSIGANTFANCSANLVLHDCLGNSFYLNADGSLGEQII